MRSSIEPSLSPPGLYTDVPSTLSEEITSLDVVAVTMSTPPINECDTFMLETRGHQYQSPAAIRRRKRPRSRRHARQKSRSVDAPPALVRRACRRRVGLAPANLSAGERNLADASGHGHDHEGLC